MVAGRGGASGISLSGLSRILSFRCARTWRSPADLYGVADPAATTRAIERFGLATYADRRAGVLSTGNLQRLGLARAFLHEPELVVLDEPANGLDPAGVVEVRDLLVAEARERGLTIFMSSHILAEVDRLATRIGIIHNGRLVEELDKGELERRRRRRLVVDARDRAKAAAALGAAGYEVTAADEDGPLEIRDERAIDAPDEVALRPRRSGRAADSARRRAGGSGAALPPPHGRRPTLPTGGVR